jgi:hypothetical protein
MSTAWVVYCDTDADDAGDAEDVAHGEGEYLKMSESVGFWRKTRLLENI